MYAGKRVLVTGGGGFLGSHLCLALAALGAEVHAVGRTAPPAAAESPRWYVRDLSSMPAVDEVVRASRPDVVFHLAGHAVGSRELDVVLPSMQSELILTLNVLTTVAQRGTGRLVLTGSLEEPVAQPAVPSSPYAAAKWAGTGFARMFHLLYATPVVIARPFMTYGPGQRTDKLVPQVIRSLLQGEAPKVSSGRRMVDWVYVDDLTRGLLLAGGRAGIEGDEFDLGSGRLVSVREVVEQLVRATGSTVAAQFGVLPDRRYEVERRADAASTRTRLGWEAAISLEDGLQRTVDWYRGRH
jgi:nucleoside-diphosphate-sugar epimerase